MPFSFLSTPPRPLSWDLTTLLRHCTIGQQQERVAGAILYWESVKEVTPAPLTLKEIASKAGMTEGEVSRSVEGANRTSMKGDKIWVPGLIEKKLVTKWPQAQGIYYGIHRRPYLWPLRTKHMSRMDYGKVLMAAIDDNATLIREKPVELSDILYPLVRGTEQEFVHSLVEMARTKDSPEHYLWVVLMFRQFIPADWALKQAKEKQTLLPWGEDKAPVTPTLIIDEEKIPEPMGRTFQELFERIVGRGETRGT